MSVFKPWKLCEAQLERFFAQGDLKGAGHAARNVLQRPDLAKALGRRIGEAYNAWQKKQKAQDPARRLPHRSGRCGSKPMVPFWGRCTTHFS